MGCGISTQNKSSATNGPEGFAVTGQRIHPRPKEEPKKKEEPKLHKIPSEGAIAVNANAVNIPNSKSQEQIKKVSKKSTKEQPKKHKKKDSEDNDSNDADGIPDRNDELIDYIEKNCFAEDLEQTQESCIKMIKKYGVPNFLELVQDISEFTVERAYTIFQVLEIVSRNPKQCNNLVQKNATRILLNIMIRYLDNHHIMVLVLATLSNLSLKDKKWALLVRLEGGIPAILAGLKVHSDNIDYRTEACKFLVKLSQNANNVMAIIRANGANDALMLVNKPGNREILVMALKFLANLTHTEMSVKQLVKANEAIPFVITEMICNGTDDLEVMQLLLTITKNLSFDPKVKGLVSLQVLNELLKTYGNNYEILSLICGTMWRVAAPNVKSPIPTTSFTHQLSKTLEPSLSTVQKPLESSEYDIEQPNMITEGMRDPDDSDDSEGEYHENGSEEEELPYQEQDMDATEAARIFPEKYPNSTFGAVDHTIKSVKVFNHFSPPEHLIFDSAPDPLHTENNQQITVDVMLHDLERITKSDQKHKIIFDALEPESINYDPTTTLQFDSSFESGNLRRAIYVSEFEYDLVTNTDINSDKHTQWYYFAVSNMKAGVTYKFNIINFEKPNSEYNFGMLPLFYSEKAAQNGVGWVRTGKNVCYYKNHYTQQTSKSAKNYYTLTFSMQFQYEDDTAYFAACYPYTATQLKKYLQGIEENEAYKDRFKRTLLCYTNMGNACDLLTITSMPVSEDALRERRYVLFSARVHPGESQANWMMKGIIDFLLGDSEEARALRDNFVFKIIPMLNMDGVIEGNHRFGIVPADLNRHWIHPDTALHPTIFATKQLIMHIISLSSLTLFVDLHGHIRKKNVFMFGCNNDHDPNLRFQECIIPYLLSKRDPNFSFENCSFKIPPAKRGCGRVVVGKDLKVLNSFTMEASFSGVNNGPNAGLHLNTKLLEEIGHNLCQVLLFYSSPINAPKIQQTLEEITKLKESAEESSESKPKKKLKKKLKKKSTTSVL